MTPITSAPASPTVLTCRDTRDFVSAVPALVGFQPRNSLVIVRFSGRRATRAIRVDLPPGTDPSSDRDYVDALCDLLRRGGGPRDRPAAVVYTDRSFRGSAGAPHHRLIRQFDRRLRAAGTGLRDAACVAADGWSGFFGESRGIPRPLAELDGQLRFPALPDARISRALADIGTIPEVEADLRARVRREIAQRTRDDHSAPDARPRDFGTPAAHALAAAIAHPGRSLTPAECADTLLACRTGRGWMHLALVSLMESPVGPDPATDSHRSLALADTLTALGEVPPDRERLTRASSRFAEAAGAAPSELAAGVRLLLAWAWWVQGLQSVADRHLRSASELDPAHPMRDACSATIAKLPGWLFTDDR